jgi:hypothetical protein
MPRRSPKVTGVWESFTSEPVDIAELDDLILVRIHSIGRDSHSGLELDPHSTVLWRFEGDQPCSLTSFRDPDEAERAARSQGAD